MPDRTLVILPTYNEAENVIPLIREILLHAPGVSVLVVDDNSPDGTADLVEQEAGIHLIRRPGKLGLGSAYLAGFRFALEHGFELAITMDCDWSHHPRYIPHLIESANEHDLVVGSRYVPGGGIANWPRRRRLLSLAANQYARFLLRVPVHDCTAGFRCYRRNVLESVDPFEIRASGYSFLQEMVWRVHRCGFSIGEIPILFEQRVAGQSKIDASEIYRAIWHVLATAVRPPPVRGGAPEPVLKREKGY